MKLFVVPLSRSFLAAALAAGCADAGDAGPEAAPAQPAPVMETACGVRLEEVALYQGVEVVLGRRGLPVAAQNADVIEGRAALLRAFVTPADSTGVALSARLTIVSAAASRSYDTTRTIAAASSKGDLDSTLNFAVPAEELTVDASMALEITAPSACPGGPVARFPASGNLPLRPLRTGTLTVRLVPIRYDTDGSGRLPDTSPEQLERFRSLLQAIFPVTSVELEVRQAVGTSVDLSGQRGWSDLLEAMRDVRARDAPPANVYYYGLVAPAPSPGAYCLGSCIGGIAHVAPPDNPGLRVGAGVGYPGLVTAESLAHELGHAHGRPHAPCGAVNRPDPGYPYPQADVGGWGLDSRGTGKLEPPDRKDLMSYCSPRWISDYNFRALAARSAQVNLAGPVVQALRLGPAPRWRVLLVDAAGQPRWGFAAEGAPPGTPATADQLDEAGAVRGPIEVWRATLGDGDETAYWVPLAATSARGAIRIAGAAPLPFDDDAAVTPLLP